LVAFREMDFSVPLRGSLFFSCTLTPWFILLSWGVFCSSNCKPWPSGHIYCGAQGNG
jgi:hypothetical protein